MKVLNKVLTICSLPPRSALLQTAFLSVLLGGAIGCSPLNQLPLAWSSPPVVAILDLAQKKSDRTVYIKGKVVDRVPFIDSGSYQLQDGSGSVWVLTDKALPALGTEMTIKGEIEYQPIPIGRQDIGELYVRELETMQATGSSAPVPTTETKPEPTPLPATQPAPPESKPASIPLPITQPAPPEAKPESKPAIAPAPIPTSQPIAQPVPEPAAQPVALPPEAKPTSEPAAKPVVKPAAQPAAKPQFNNDLFFQHKRNTK